MVAVGPGNQPGESWWIVAIVTNPPDGVTIGTAVFLTNNPSPRQPSGDQWILVGYRQNSGPLEDLWSWVPWDEQRLSLGRAAQAKALSCLPQ